MENKDIIPLSELFTKAGLVYIFKTAIGGILILFVIGVLTILLTDHIYGMKEISPKQYHFLYELKENGYTESSWFLSEKIYRYRSTEEFSSKLHEYMEDGKITYRELNKLRATLEDNNTAMLPYDMQYLLEHLNTRTED